MKHNIYFLILLILYTGLAKCQTLNKNITVAYENISIEQILDGISRKYGIEFSYSLDYISLNKKVSVHLKNQPLQEVLKVLFKNTAIRYSIIEDHVVLKEERNNKISKKTISGYVKEKGSGETLTGVNIYSYDLLAGTTTNKYGFYSLTLEETDSLTLTYSFVGYTPQHEKISLNKNVELNIELGSDLRLAEVVVTGQHQENISQLPQMSSIKIPLAQIKEVPALMGEKDVLKVLQLMPGVQKAGEGNSGFYVRGGGADQNLIILDDAPVYNANHLFGFFSLFNGDALKSVELTKGGFPARYGGRLSSVIEMSMKEGNKEKLHGEAGVGLISSRLTLEGPIIKNKASFLISARRTYADLLIKPFLYEGMKLGYHFYDLNMKLNYDFGQKDKLYLSGFLGKDKFSYSEDFTIINSNGKRGSESYSKEGLNWGNTTGVLRWNHLFNERLFSNVSLIFTNYKFNLLIKDVSYSDTWIYANQSGINDFGFKYDFDFNLNPKHFIKFGLISTSHCFSPGVRVAKDDTDTEDRRVTKAINTQESGIYIEDTYRPLPAVRVNGGIRVSHYLVNNKSYINPEPRITGSYSIKDDLSVKASYARMNQYIHLLSNTGPGLPTDLWVPSTDRIPSQRAEQIATGIAKDFLRKNVTFTLEGYYKKMNNVLGYKEGSGFFVIDEERQAPPDWQDIVTFGKGWSYGMEVLLQKKTGRFTGWIGYTLSKTLLQFDSLNFGKKFYARYDRRHDISLVGIFHITDKITLSGNWVYGSGNAITVPVGDYRVQDSPKDKWSPYGTYVVDYGIKNGFRMAPYHRLDIGVKFYKKKKKWGERTWEIGIYNVYNRKNPFYYTLANDIDETARTDKTYLKKVSLLPILPSINYSVKF